MSESARRIVPQPVALLGMGQAFPPGLPQNIAAGIAADRCASDSTQAQWVQAIFRKTGVDSRGTALLTGTDGDPSQVVQRFFGPRTSDADTGPTTADRMAVYARHAPALAEEASREALDDAQFSAGQITHLITVSCTGFFAPGVDVALIKRLGLLPSVKRLHVGFMGCHAAFNSLSAAADMVRADPSARVLVCCVELCSLHFAYGWHPQRLVANSLFADAAAAAVVGPASAAGDSAWRLHDAASLLLPGSEDAMTWCIGNNGFEMTLSPQVPDLIRQHVKGWLDVWLAERELSIADIPNWAIHPGGPKVLSSVCNSLELRPEVAEVSRRMLAEHGNVSSATILCILSQLRESAQPGPCVALGFGPGLMAEAMLLRHRDKIS